MTPLFLNDGAGNFTNVSEQFGIVELTKNVVLLRSRLAT